MATITIEADGNKITLIISPSDAFKILKEYENKYPNTKSALSLNEFINKWSKNAVDV